MTFCDLFFFLDCSNGSAQEAARAVPEISSVALSSTLAFVGGVLAIVTDRTHASSRSIPPAAPVVGAVGDSLSRVELSPSSMGQDDASTGAVR